MQNANRAEAIRQGAINSGKLSKKRKEKRIADYLKNPKLCGYCKKELDYEDRRKEFCNRSCSAKFNNKSREDRKVPATWHCLNCGKEHETVAWRVGKYCNLKCQKEFQSKERVRQWLEEDKDWKRQAPQWAKNYLQELRGEGCEICGITEWNRKSIVLEMDHIDGNHEHNHPDNLRLICPNCHSQTDTYKAKNTGKGRSYRVKP